MEVGIIDSRTFRLTRPRAWWRRPLVVHAATFLAGAAVALLVVAVVSP